MYRYYSTIINRNIVSLHARTQVGNVLKPYVLSEETLNAIAVVQVDKVEHRFMHRVRPVPFLLCSLVITDVPARPLKLKLIHLKDIR